MTDPMDDASLVWGELLRDAHARAPRLDPFIWGFCPSCGLSPSDGGNFVGIHWACCLTCRARWIVTLPPAYALYQLDDDSAAEFALVLSECIDIEPLPAEILPPEILISDTSRQETSTMRNTTPAALKSFGIDLHRFAGPKENKVLSSLTADQRIAVTDRVLADLKEFPLTARHPMSGRILVTNYHAMWSRIRDLTIDDKGNTVGRVLQRVEIPAPALALKDVIVLFLDLREKRALLERQLHDLDAIEAAFASSEAAPAVVGG